MLRSVASFAEKEKWDVFLLTEVRADRNGVVWLGENNNLVAVIHSEKAAVLQENFWDHGVKMDRLRNTRGDVLQSSWRILC
jgi:hypothetical protein